MSRETVAGGSEGRQMSVSTQSSTNISAVKAQAGLKETGTRHALMCVCNQECGRGAHVALTDCR